ncbi:glycogen debranching N-terminal domain-containing protein [Streptomyces sp. NPDC060194]|uniref:amylo-alpha-1,6-glucosidase n=1 Tax=Streptomyces sp. NPDC060194 TaxID=3347069 RepID=UPI00364BCD8C
MSRLLVHDGTFALLTDAGDVTGVRGATPDGLFRRDTRHLSRWRLHADGSELTVLTDGVLTPPGTRDEPPAYTVLREQSVRDGALRESLRLVSNRPEPLSLALDLTCDADFADQFELRSDHRTYDKPDARREAVVTAAGVDFRYERGPDWVRGTAVAAQPAPAEVVAGEAGHVLRWQVELPAHGTARVELTATALPEISATDAVPASAEPARPRERHDLTAWHELARACTQGLDDLALLRVPADGPDGEPLRAPAAGIPWFLTLFGRDSLLTSLFALRQAPELADATLRALAATQGRVEDPSRLEQPGRIVHEVRHGELAHFRQVPYGRYYGTVDATPLFLVLLEAHGDQVLARRLEPQARAAVEWMFRDGGLGDGGYLVYASDAAAGGLANQNWKDSPGAICHPDGTQASGPIAVAEAQGYAYDALVRTARLARGVWGDAVYADRLESEAAALRERFARDFWMPEAGFPALALDGEGRRVDTLASDAGHLLWSGILSQERAEATGRRLMEPDFFSGWGIRTLAAGQTPYHPLSYHRGSIWPHDNAVIALGLARHGLEDEVRRLAEGLVDAAAGHGWRLPEVMAGYGRDEHPAPVPYPHSCSPQAWAAATPLALLTAVDGVLEG